GVADSILATAISAQMTTDHDLSFCSRSASRPIDNSGSDDRSKCTNFSGDDVSKGAALGAFQNFAVVRPGQQIFFARDVDQRT
ncbi:hypothetical protein, partial [Leadbetterella sp. DM7]|uniref:hypothetical protein n=1 Tax=Leadbetterella sp. DM7 TaxID=3235085 RepID=UPI00349ED8C5